MERRVAFPIVGVGIHHDALHRRRGVVAFPARRLATVILGNNDAAAVWVKQNLGGIEPHSVRGIEWSVSPIPVKLSRLHVRHEYMPIMVGTVSRRIDRDHARGPGVIFPVKEHQLHAGASRE